VLEGPHGGLLLCHSGGSLHKAALRAHPVMAPHGLD